MAINPSQIEAQFAKLNRGLNFDQVLEDTSELMTARLTGVTTQLGFNPGQVVAGFESLTASIDDVIPSVTGSAPQQLIDRLGVAQMTQNVPEIGQRLVLSMDTVASNAASEMAAITGAAAEAIDNGFVEAVTAAPTPEALSAALGQVTDVSVDEVFTVMNEVVNLDLPLSEFVTSAQETVEGFYDSLPPIAQDLKNVKGSIDNALNKVVTQGVTSVSRVTKDAEKVFSNISGQLSATLANANKGFGSIISNLVDTASGNVLQAVNSIASVSGIQQTIPDSVLNKVRASMNTGDFTQAATILSSFSDNSLQQIEDTLRNIDTTLSGNISTPGRGGASISTRNIGANEALWNEADTPDEAFSLVRTEEELEVELKSIQREITEIIVHWTETNINQDIGAEEIHSFAVRNGQGVPYHYLIRRDGSLQRGRPINEVGSTLRNNHQQYSIQIAFVGGINAPSEVEEITQFLSKDSLTTAQMRTFKKFLEKSYAAWPGVQALGHNEIDPQQVDPGFNVTRYVKDTFSKESIYTDITAQQPYPRRTLISTRLADYDY